MTCLCSRGVWVCLYSSTCVKANAVCCLCSRGLMQPVVFAEVRHVLRLIQCGIIISSINAPNCTRGLCPDLLLHCSFQGAKWIDIKCQGANWNFPKLKQWRHRRRRSLGIAWESHLFTIISLFSLLYRSEGMLTRSSSCSSLRLVQPPPAASPTADVALYKRFLCTSRLTYPARYRIVPSSARIATMDSNNSSSVSSDLADQPVGSFGFLTKKVYVPPPWATHLRPLPTHVFSLGQVSFSVYRQLFSSRYSTVGKQRIDCTST